MAKLDTSVRSFIRLGRLTMSCTAAEAQAVKNIIAWFDTVDGMPMQPDDPTGIHVVSQNTLTPALVKRVVRTELEAVTNDARASIIEIRLLDAVEINGTPFRVLERMRRA